MKIDMDENVFHTIKTAIGYPPELTWNNIRYVIICKVAQVTKKIDNFGKVKS